MWVFACSCCWIETWFDLILPLVFYPVGSVICISCYTYAFICISCYTYALFVYKFLYMCLFMHIAVKIICIMIGSVPILVFHLKLSMMMSYQLYPLSRFQSSADGLAKT